MKCKNVRIGFIVPFAVVEQKQKCVLTPF